MRIRMARFSSSARALGRSPVVIEKVEPLISVAHRRPRVSNASFQEIFKSQ